MDQKNSLARQPTRRIFDDAEVLRERHRRSQRLRTALAERQLLHRQIQGVPPRCVRALSSAFIGAQVHEMKNIR